MQNKLHPLTVEIINNMISEKKHKGLDDAVMTKISDRIMDQGQKPYFLIKDALIYMELEDYDRAKLCIDAAFIFRGLTFSDNKENEENDANCFYRICAMASHYNSLLKDDDMVGL